MKSNNTLTRVFVFFLVLLFAMGGIILWWIDGTRAVDPGNTSPVMFAVSSGDGVRGIAANLKKERLIRSPTVFFMLIKLMGIEHNLQAGDFRLNRAMGAETVAKELTHGFTDIWVTTLEGWRMEEIANRLAKDLDLPESQFLGAAREGYMFPDTYLIPRDATAAGIAKIFLDTFDKKVTPVMRQDLKAKGLTLHEMVTLASIVEREGRTDEDRPVIAGILLKRLNAGWPLQADATLQYALGYQSMEKTWWKKALSDADRAVKSPYNTYLNVGLPPGPICNPGLASINAVIYAKETDYWYYLHDNAGGVHFAKTIEEQNANIAKYLRD